MPDSQRLHCRRGAQITVLLDGAPVTCFEGETVSTVLLAAAVTAFHRGVDDSPRMPFCNMGACYECTVTIDGQALQRACLVPVRPGMHISTAQAR